MSAFLLRLLKSRCILSAAIVLLGNEVNSIADDKEPDRWAVLIGINDYAHARDLRYCLADQMALKEELIRAGFDDRQVTLLHDDAKDKPLLPFKSNIEKQIELVCKLADKGDLVLLSFSGHGIHIGKTSYLCPTDASPDDTSSLISMEWIYDQLKKSKAGLRLVIIDACRNVPVESSRTRDFTAKDVEENSREFVKSAIQVPNGIMLLNSCSEGEKSAEDEQFEHGVFMYFVLQGMKGRADRDNDGQISLGELTGFTSKETRLHVAKRFGDAQVPKLQGNLEGSVLDFSIATPLKPKVAESAPARTIPMRPEPINPAPMKPKPKPSTDASKVDLASNGGDWPQWRGPNRDGRSLESIQNDNWEDHPPQLLWNIDGMGQGYATVSISADCIFTVGTFEDGERLLCLDATSGKKLWSCLLGGIKTSDLPQRGGSRGAPAVDDELVFVITFHGALHCVNRKTGDLIWKRDFAEEWQGSLMGGFGYAESPLVDGDRVICTPGGRDAMMVALNKSNGDEIWRCKVPEFEGAGKKTGAGYSSIVVSNGGGRKQYVQLTGVGLIGVDANDGQFLWGNGRIADSPWNISTPLAIDNFVLASTAPGGTVLLELKENGNQIFATEKYYLDQKTFVDRLGGMIRNGDYVYASHGMSGCFPVCLKWKTGEVVWKERSGSGGEPATVAGVGDHLLVRSRSGIELLEANPNEYRRLGLLEPETSGADEFAHPVVSNARLYVRTQENLMCYRLTDSD